MRGPSGVALLYLLAMLVPAGAADAANFVVVEARGIDLRPGATIDGSKPIKLSEGQQLVLISSTGKTIKLRGPLDQAPATEGGDSSADVVGALNSLVTQKIARSDKAGLVRGAKEELIPPQPWLLDVTHSGTRCVAEGNAIRFWRPTAGGEGKLSIVPYDRSWRLVAEWPAGTNELTPPSAVPLRDHATYIVRIDRTESTVTLLTIPAAIDNDAMRVGWMAEKGCEAQAQALLRTLR